MTVLVMIGGRHRRMTECASCGLFKIHYGRGLCASCRTRYRRNGTIADYGYVKSARLEDYAWLRTECGASVAEAAARIGVSARTGWRYERQLRAAQPARTAGGTP